MCEGIRQRSVPNLAGHCECDCESVATVTFSELDARGGMDLYDSLFDCCDVFRV